MLSHLSTRIPVYLTILVLIVPIGIEAAPTTSTSSIGITPTTTIATGSNPAVTPTAIPDTRRAKLQPVAQTRITNLAANLSNRLDATTRRLSNVHSRLQSREAKLQESGLDTSAAEASLVAAAQQLEAATKTLSTIDREVAAFVGSEDPVTAWLRLESIYTTIAGNVISAHRSLTTALTALENAPVRTTTTTASSSSGTR